MPEFVASRLIRQRPLQLLRVGLFGCALLGCTVPVVGQIQPSPLVPNHPASLNQPQALVPDNSGTGNFDTGKFDTGKFDTGKFDTGNFDTGTSATGNSDTGNLASEHLGSEHLGSEHLGSEQPLKTPARGSPSLDGPQPGEARHSEDHFLGDFFQDNEAIGSQAEASPRNRLLDDLAADGWISPRGIGRSLGVVAALGILSLAPAIVLMTTCYVRVIVVLGILRQALGTPQLPPMQVITTLSLFLTLLVMAPVFQKAYQQGVVPYQQHQINAEEAWKRGTAPLQQFMARQIDQAGNEEDVWLFLEYCPQAGPIQTYDDVPLVALLPAFLLSELKTAFLIGFQLYLPFIVLDLVVSLVTSSLGMIMLPPGVISLPLKLLLFVLVDGWHLVIGMLLQSIEPASQTACATLLQEAII